MKKEFKLSEKVKKDFGRIFKRATKIKFNFN